MGAGGAREHGPGTREPRSRVAETGDDRQIQSGGCAGSSGGWGHRPPSSSGGVGPRAGRREDGRQHESLMGNVQ